MNNFKDFIKSITEDYFWLGLFDLMLLITPGFLLIFYFDRTLFMSLDTLKLILLSVAFVAPFALVNAFSLLSMREETEKEAVVICFSLGIFYAAFSCFLALFISYLFKLAFIITIFMLLGLNIILVAIAIEEHIKGGKEKLKK